MPVNKVKQPGYNSCLQQLPSSRDSETFATILVAWEEFLSYILWPFWIRNFAR
jgi:hypothetical protein